MRLFVGIQPSPVFRAALAEVQERLRMAGVRGRWLDPSNLHLTLAFIGEWQENIIKWLPGVEEPFRITLSHVGIFTEASVLWAGVQPSPELDLLAACVRQNLNQAGIPFDRKAFYPHITLARKPSVPSELALSGLAIPESSMIVPEVCLYQSARGEHGMVYSVIGRKGT